MRRGNLLWVLVVVLLTLGAVCTLSGCRMSEAVMQIIHEQTAEQVDEESPVELTREAPESERSEEVRASVTGEAERQREKDERTPVYGPGTAAGTASQSVKKSRKGAAETTTPGAGGKGTAGGGASGGQDVDKEGGEQQETPEYSGHLVAVGEVAAIVCMLGAADDLVATSANIVAASSLYGTGVKTANPLWGGEGEQALKSLDELLALKPRTVLRESQSAMLTDEQVSTLEDAGVTVVTVRRLSSAANIKDAVTEVAQVLGTAQAQSKARSYAALHDEVVQRALAANGGKYTTYANQDYSGEQASLPDSQCKSDKWTLYVGGWDTASYRGTWQGSSVVSANHGVGVARLGYTTQPVSYYLSAGGVVNTAATFNGIHYEGVNMYVWQFNANYLSAAKSYWSGSGATVKNMTGSGVTESLLCTKGAEWQGLGSPCYPAVVVASKAMKTQMEQDRDSGRGIYTVYPFHTKDHDTSGVGIKVGTTILASVIGAEATASRQTGTGYEVYVNPHGIVSSWTDGSVESPLESLWAAVVFQGLDEGVLEEYVQRFYREMYGVELSASQCARILDGTYCG